MSRMDLERADVFARNLNQSRGSTAGSAFAELSEVAREVCMYMHIRARYCDSLELSGTDVTKPGPFPCRSV